MTNATEQKKKKPGLVFFASSRLYCRAFFSLPKQEFRFPAVVV